MSRAAQIRAAAAAVALGLLLGVLTVLDIYGDKIMKRALRLAAVAGVCLLAACTAGCATFDPVKFAQAANQLDPGCGKLVDIRVGTNWVFGWPVPVVTGAYTKACKPEQLRGLAPAQPGLQLGQTVD